MLADFLARVRVRICVRMRTLYITPRLTLPTVAAYENAALSDGFLILLKSYYLLERFFNSSSQILATLLAGTSS